jgi:hypothetical protein
MKIAPFATEHFFAKYEFNTPHQLCNSDCETTTVGELLQMAGVEMAEFADLSLGYTESAGNPALREALAEGYGRPSPTTSSSSAPQSKGSTSPLALFSTPAMRWSCSHLPMMR